MNTLTTTGLPTGAWDIVSFFENAKEYISIAGGGLLSLLGLAIVIWAGVLIAKKFFGGQSAQQESWVKVVVMIIVGGALMTGGIVLITKIAEGGQTTIEDLGGAFIVSQNLLSLLG